MVIRGLKQYSLMIIAYTTMTQMLTWTAEWQIIIFVRFTAKDIKKTIFIKTFD